VRRGMQMNVMAVRDDDVRYDGGLDAIENREIKNPPL